MRRGIIPDAGGAYLLPRIVGPQRAKELMFLGDELSAADCERWGIANRVVPAADLGATVDELAARLAAGADEGDRHDQVARQPQLRVEPAQRPSRRRPTRRSWSTATADMAEGIAAFGERRRPDFKGW